MTNTDIILRINDAIRSGDLDDLETLIQIVNGLMIEETALDAWLALIETAQDAINGRL